MSVIAVTGCTGFVGGHLRSLATARGDFVRAIPREVCLDSPAMVRAFAGADAVVHLAARAHQLKDPAPDPVSAFRAVNVDLTREVARACTRASVRRLVFVSSAGVLGCSSPPAGFSDDGESAPHDAYTRSKLEAEEMLLAEFAESLDVCIVRPPLVYGPGAPGNFARLIRAATTGLPLPIGALRASRSMISVRNLCDLLLALTTVHGMHGQRMLAADDESVSILELVQMIARAHGSEPRIVNVPVPVLEVALRLLGREADLTRLSCPFVIRATRCREALGWRPPFRLENEIAWTVAAMKPGSL